MRRDHCQFISDEVLQRLAADPGLSQEAREQAAHTVRLNRLFCDIRDQNLALSGFLQKNHQLVELSPHPDVTLFDCHNTQSLPGLQIKEPALSKDESVQRTFTETGLMATFLREVFQRNSVDDAGMTLMSAVHYGNKYNNAMWNGVQMIYGDGDGELFIDLTTGMDVIGHELAHGLTQYTLQLEYDEEPGGLNESLSDCFGAMFRQWRLKQDAVSADWLIGSDVIGRLTRERGFTCLRDMAQPSGAHCISSQPTRYGELKPGQDPHSTSGPPNLAFCTACKVVGGPSWESVGKVWYHVMTNAGSVPRMSMAQFAARTRVAATELYGKHSRVEAAIDAGWKRVEL